MPENFINQASNDSGQSTKGGGVKNRRFIFGLFISIGVIGLALGFLKLTINIRSPFSSEIAENTDLINLSLTSDQQAEIESLKTKDTDQDGLSDYDELYKYGTSPYLADSDSDGFSDKTEIDSGNNPNCPSGKDCSAVILSNTNTAVNAGETNTTLPTNETALVTGQISMSDLRETLKKAGAPEATLNQMDDAALKQVYEEVLGQELANSNLNSVLTNAGQAGANTNQAVNLNGNISAEELKNLTPAEIREFLKLGGVDETTLQSLDDTTLQAIFLQALAS